MGPSVRHKSRLVAGPHVLYPVCLGCKPPSVPPPEESLYLLCILMSETIDYRSKRLRGY